MSDTLSIYQSLARLMFPEGLLDYFTVVGVEEKDIPLSEQQGVETGEIIFHLDEMDQLQHPEEGHTYRPNGFYEPGVSYHNSRVYEKQGSLKLRLPVDLPT